MKLVRSFFTSLHKTVFIFDKDGTLIDTETIYFKAFDLLLAKYGCQHDHGTHADMMGAPIDICLDILRKRHAEFPQDPVKDALLRADLAWNISEVRREHGTRTMDGAPTFLGVSRYHGVRLGMATSAKRENADMDLKTLGWSKYFEAIVTAEDVANHKPAPDVYLEAARRMKVDPADCVAFEDGPRGVKSAHAAGMRVVFVRDKRFGIEPPAEAHLTVNSLNELIS